MLRAVRLEGVGEGRGQAQRGGVGILVDGDGVPPERIDPSDGVFAVPVEILAAEEPDGIGADVPTDRRIVVAIAIVEEAGLRVLELARCADVGLRALSCDELSIGVVGERADEVAGAVDELLGHAGWSRDVVPHHAIVVVVPERRDDVAVFGDVGSYGAIFRGVEAYLVAHGRSVPDVVHRSLRHVIAVRSWANHRLARPPGRRVVRERDRPSVGEVDASQEPVTVPVIARERVVTRIPPLAEKAARVEGVRETIGPDEPVARGDLGRSTVALRDGAPGRVDEEGLAG